MQKISIYDILIVMQPDVGATDSGVGGSARTLRSAGLKATAARIAVLRALERARRPSSVRRLAGAATLRQFDAVTVYRTLNALVAAGLVRPIDFRHGHAHYELAGDDHHHVVCTQCHRVEDVGPCAVTTITPRALHESGFARITDHALEFFGLCKGCARTP